MFQSFDASSDRGFAERHLPKLRAILKQQNLHGLLVPHDDEYQNEYLPDYAERLMWVSGFTGSAGSAVILEEKAAVFSDGRYTLQMRDQVDAEHFSLYQTPEENPAQWMVDNAPKGATIGYDPMVFSTSSLAPYLSAAQKFGITLKALKENPIDTAWTDQLDKPQEMIVPHTLEFTGKTHAEKRTMIAEKLRAEGADALLITAPTSLAWLFNVRGGDVHASPLPLGRGILHVDGSAELLVDPAKSSNSLQEHLGNDVQIIPEIALDQQLEALARGGKTVWIDPALTPLSFVSTLIDNGAKLHNATDPCALPRATKTSAELDGSRNAHIRDGAVITRFLHWLSQQTPSPELTEISVAQKLESMRMETGKLKDVSFDSISGAGPHGAICHYRVTKETDIPLEDGTLFLIDSGGQYLDGTTDITRTIAIGTPSAQMRRHYTLVLMGHVALATARFPAGTSGHQLDSMARRPLWDAGLDYDHGTGHGVGSYLGVHEGPQNISKKPINQALMPGMICSNEPGYYEADTYGIRIENLIIVTNPAPIPGGNRGMMGFETITLAPLERVLINKEMLTEKEIAWVDAYHANVRSTLSPLLSPEVRDWMNTMTAAL